MEKMRMESVDMTSQNIDKISALFPNCITETTGEDGKPRKVINFEKLRQMLSDDIIDGTEAYEFTWVGKKEAIVDANRPIRKTLRPCPEESVNWDTTENMYIEGDNFEVLKLLQESYLGKVDVIYIDPPYNTGNNLIYRNNFYQSEEEYASDSGEIDEIGNRLVLNSRSNGRFHSDWCSMIYARLLLARNLLSDDGIIVLTIDDNEIQNTISIMDEVFGEENRLGIVIIKNNPQGRSSVTGFQISHEYALFYGNVNAKIGRLPRSEEQLARYGERDKNGPFEWRNFRAQYSTESPKMVYPIFVKKDCSDFRLPNMKWNESKKQYDLLESPADDELITLPVDETGRTRTWKWSIATVMASKEEEMGVRKDRSGKPTVYYKGRMKDLGMNPYTMWDKPEYSSSTFGANMLAEIIGKGIFSYPKSLFAVIDALKVANARPDSLVLDFFSGSATTAHAVMKLNAEDDGHRRFIMVQLPEKCEEGSVPFKNGYETICKIGEERIRRSGKLVQEENPGKKLDTGFRVFKLDDSNMRDVYYSAGEYSQSLLSMLESNIKDDRNDLDLLFGCLLEWGLPLSMPYTSEKLEGCTIHTYNEGDLIACFDEDIPDSVIKTIAKRQPLRAVFRDSSFSGSPAKINVGEIFKMLAPDTRVKVI